MASVGVDQSARSSGITILSAEGEILHQKLVKTDKLRDIERLSYIRQELTKAIDQFKDDLKVGVLEGYSYGSINKKFILGEIGAVVKLVMHDAGIPVYTAAPVQVKKFAAGKIRASKPQISDAIEAKWDEVIKQDDLADSYVLARIGIEILNPTTQNRKELEVVSAITGKSKKRKRKKARRKKTDAL